MRYDFFTRNELLLGKEILFGYALSVILFNIYWIITDIKNERNYFDRYNIIKYGSISILFWLYNLSGICTFFFISFNCTIIMF